MKNNDLSIIKKAYLDLSSNSKMKYRGRFTQMIGELATIEELKKQKFQVEQKSGQSRYDILIVDCSKKIEVKACNLDNPWTKRDNLVIGGCSGIEPKKFDILIYVQFKDALDSFEYYLFTKKDASLFPYARKEKRWYAKRASEDARVLNNPFKIDFFEEMTQKDADKLNRLLKDSLSSWEKLSEKVENIHS